MSVTQTTQLIQLILNSVLMVIACVIVLSVLVIRHTAIHNRLHILNRERFELLNETEPLWNSRLVSLNKHLRHLQQQHKTASSSIFILHYALICFALSVLVLTLRTVAPVNWLVSSALVLFTGGIGLLLIGLLLVLMDFYRSNRSLWHEIKWVRDLSKEVTTEAKDRVWLSSESTYHLPSSSASYSAQANNNISRREA